MMVINVHFMEKKKIKQPYSVTYAHHNARAVWRLCSYMIALAVSWSVAFTDIYNTAQAASV